MSGEPSADLDFATPVASSSFSCSVVLPHRPAVCAGVWRRSPSIPDSLLSFSVNIVSCIRKKFMFPAGMTKF